VDSDAADSHLPTANRGGGDATPADSGADASVRLAGRTSSTQLKKQVYGFLLLGTAGMLLKGRDKEIDFLYFSYKSESV
jgi:hypothetical protein